MSKASGVVEINGNRYDATTGKIIGSVKKSAHQLRSSAGGVVDGIVRQSSQVAHKKKSAAHHRAKHTAQTFHRTTQRSKTLMRTAVRKPESKHTAVQNAASASPADITRPPTRHAVHVGNIAQHKKINRFGHIKASSSKATTTNSVKPTVRTYNAKLQAGAAIPSSLIASASHSHIERLLDNALSHKSKGQVSTRPRASHSLWHRVKVMPKWLSLGTASVILAVTAGIFTWQNIPQVAIEVASARAGFNASAPAYTPEGYRFTSPISYSRGEVAMRYQSDNGQSYRITQQSSKLDSTTLASSILSDQSNVQTSLVKGTTVYIYGEKNDATWVNNGIRYTIAEQNGLDSDQILKIAGSL